MKTLRIFFTSDIHGYFYPTSYEDQVRKEMGLFSCIHQFKKDENTLVIDGGDILQGSAFAYYCNRELHSPEIMADIMNDCGYDYYTLGNHDFNYGMKYQEKYRKIHRGKCICQNMEDLEGNVMFPYDVKVMPNGLRVGIVGIVTDFINIWEKKENLEGIQITNPFFSAKKALEEMKQFVDISICVYHGGFECDIKSGKVLSKTEENIGYKICKELDFDVLLTGHQHVSVKGQYCHDTYIVQPGEYGKEMQYIEISVTDNKMSIVSECYAASSDNLRLGKFLEQKYLFMENNIQVWLDQPVGHLQCDLLPQDKVEMALHGSPIADFLNTVQLFFSGAQISAVGLANDIAGFRKNVSVRDILATYPYPNTLVVCEITGKQLKSVMERSAEYFELDDSGKVCVANSFLIPKTEHYNYDYYMGVYYDIDPEKPIGYRIRHLSYEGKKISDTDHFTICVNNYRYSGAGGYEEYKKCKLIKQIPVEMAELIMEFFRIKNAEESSKALIE